MEAILKVPSSIDRTALFGAAERNLKMLREALGVNIAARDGVVVLRGERADVEAARQVVESLIEAAQRGQALSRQQVLDAIAQAGWAASNAERFTTEFGAAPIATTPAGRSGPSHAVVEPVSHPRGRARPGGGRAERVGMNSGNPLDEWRERPAPTSPVFATPQASEGSMNRLDVYAAGRPVIAKTANQQAYIEAILRDDMVFGIGPAGTGKTYLAVAAAIHLLRSGRVKRAVLARPAVEAGEKLGFLPGDQFAKVNPYLRPLLDALHDMMDYATIKRFMASDVVEISPLAFMRGRTLNDAVIILDEAQNTTRGQMQMFLTRMGQRSKMIVTGDTTQIDLPEPRESGLIDAARRLRRVPGISFIALTKQDVVRHDLVQRIIDAYEPREEGGPESGA